MLAGETWDRTSIEQNVFYGIYYTVNLTHSSVKVIHRHIWWNGILIVTKYRTEQLAVLLYFVTLTRNIKITLSLHLTHNLLLLKICDDGVSLKDRVKWTLSIV